MAARCVMVLGTTSGAGKSLIATALCRYYANQGYKVAPFKAQNMSNNARVVDADGAEGEMGSAQYYQALAARVEPHVRMNPVLLKPEAQGKLQVILLGQVDRELSTMPWRNRSETLWPHIRESLDLLIQTNDVVVIEGAGSPAEINLMTNDIVNLRVARHANAKCLLVTDIDRGGAFAHLYGTWALLDEQDKGLIRGFVLNKFRGDAALLAPAPEMLEKMTGIPVVATIPMLRAHGLPEEDGVFDERAIRSQVCTIKIAIIVYPGVSNLDEFQPLKNTASVHLVWAREARDLVGADWIILPGSKQTSSDLDWLRAQGLDVVIKEHARCRKKILGICGGLQMLGAAMSDPHQIDGARDGLNLLPLQTMFAKDKTVRKSSVQFGHMTGEWGFLSTLNITGYEIHHGLTSELVAPVARAPLVTVIPDLAWTNAHGNVLGIYVHGLFEATAVMQAAFGISSRSLDAVFDQLASHFEAHATPDILQALVV